MKYQNWVLREKEESGDQEKLCGFGQLTSRVLRARGIQDSAHAREFLKTSAFELGNPFLLKDMDKAVTRVEQALERKERIVVYGDYDVDGVTAVVVLYRYLRGCGADITWYIPHRLDEGYGLHEDAIDILKGQGAQLIITVDTGITAVKEVEYARQLGIDVVITDHHECRSELPKACAVVNPHRPDDEYPFKNLAGVGVAFKLISALHGNEHSSCLLGHYGDLVALGTVADVMEMTGENRIIVRSGICSIEAKKNIGIAKLLQEAGAADRKMSTSGIGFVIAPRINAAGRMGEVEVAVQLLLSENEYEATKLAEKLCELNQKRQEIESAIYNECCEHWDRINAQGELPSVLVTEGQEWHPGVIGIVASKLTERYCRPVMMISVSDGIGQGSARSIKGFNLVEALEVHKRFLIDYGGHEMAAGFTIEKSQIGNLREHMEEYALDFSEACKMMQVLNMDVKLKIQEATEENIRDLQELEPYGLGNTQPVFYLEDVELVSFSRIGGGKHIRMKLGDGRYSIDAIWFGVGDSFDFQPGLGIDVAGTIDMNYYRNLVSVQMVVMDVRRSTIQFNRKNEEKKIYLKLISQIPLSKEEAQRIYPDRDYCVAFWRYLKRNAGSDHRLERPLPHIARSVSFEAREDPSYGKTMVCLNVMSECGLLEYHVADDNVSIELFSVEGKVDLYNGTLMKCLREMMN